jgi:predicted GNAT superfamily acetyltransferase
MIEYRSLHTMPELEAVVDLQIAVWGLNPRNAVPSAVLHVLALNGGLVLGAYDGQRMVGLLICMPAYNENQWILWSHMTGTHPDYQKRGVGLALKRFQRRWALENGYRTVRWTMDPLQRGNAHFNLRLLGVDACMYFNTYHVNFYGDMDDAINRGMPSDRVEVVWRLDQPSLQKPAPPDTPLLLGADKRDYPALADADTAWDQPAYLVSVPRDLDGLRRTDRQAALEWRLALRQVMQAGFEHGYAAVDFSDNAVDCAYILRRLAGAG